MASQLLFIFNFSHCKRHCFFQWYGLPAGPGFLECCISQFGAQLRDEIFILYLTKGLALGASEPFEIRFF